MRKLIKRRVACITALIALGVSASYGQTNGQPDAPAQSNTPNSQKPPTLQQKIVVSANLSPAEVEDGRLNKLYEVARKLGDQDNCPGTVEKLRTLVIPAAEQSKFDVPRNKFLFLSYKEIADCDLTAGSYAEGEQMYQKSLEYVPVWPGLTDSEYPIILRSIGMARLDQQNWKGAEEILLKADAIFDKRIDAAIQSKSIFERTEEANDLRTSQAVNSELLAVACLREQRAGDALKLLDHAYIEATTGRAPDAILNRIVREGLSASTVSGDADAKVLWTQRFNSSSK